MGAEFGKTPKKVMWIKGRPFFNLTCEYWIRWGFLNLLFIFFALDYGLTQNVFISKRWLQGNPTLANYNCKARNLIKKF